MLKSRLESVIELREKGYNCTQAVTCTYADLFDLDVKDVFRASEAFGLGIAGAMNTCGAALGIVYLAGLKYSDGNLEKPASKHETYKKTKALIDLFAAKNSSTICREIKGLNTGKCLRSCNGCVIDACRIVEQELFNGMFEVSNFDVK